MKDQASTLSLNNLRPMIRVEEEEGEREINICEQICAKYSTRYLCMYFFIHGTIL